MLSYIKVGKELSHKDSDTNSRQLSLRGKIWTMKPNKQYLVDLDDIKPNTGSSIMTL